MSYTNYVGYTFIPAPLFYPNMARDTKPSEIELKRDDFSTDKQALAAERLQEHWNSNLTFKELEEEKYPGDDEPSQSLYRKVFNEYFGPVGDRRTFEQVRAEFDTISDYIEERNAGNIELDFGRNENELTEREFEILQEGFKKGMRYAEEHEYNKGWDRALDMVERVGVENVPRMCEDNDQDEEIPFQIG